MTAQTSSPKRSTLAGHDMPENPEWPVGAGEMRSAIRNFDWSASTLGPLPAWPQCLRTTVDTLLGMPMPALLLWSRDGIMLYNDAYAQIAGAQHPWLLGRPVKDGCSEHTDFHTEVMKVVLTGDSVAFRDQEFLLQRNGKTETAWLNLDFSPVRDEQGVPMGALAIVTDTTERVRVEQALRANEMRLSAIFARAMVGLSEISPQGKFMRVNDELCRMLGRPRELLLQLGVADVTHPDDVPKSLVAVGALLERGEPASIDKRYVRPDDTLIWANSSLTRLDDEDGAPNSLLVVTVDLTARMQAEQALAENEARFRALAETCPALIWHLDPSGNVKYTNSRSIDLMDIPPEQLFGTSWFTVLHPDDAASYLKAIRHAQLTRQSMTHRVRVKHAHDGWRWLESHAAPWFREDGSYAGHVGIALDVTDEVRAREELAISNERLNFALEGAGDAIWDWDIASNCLLHSDKLNAVLGLHQQTEISAYGEWEKRVHPDDLPQVLAALDACLKGSTVSFQSEYRIRSDTGDWKWLLTRAIVVQRDVRNHPLRMTGTVSDITEKRRSEEIIWRHANFDTLTGLPNRRLFRDRLDHDVKKAHRTHLPLALFFIDLDRFKEANDLLGHDIGDQLLVEAAKRISGCMRESDTVARLGGDEFTAILTELDDLAHVEMLAQKIIDVLASPFHLGSEVVYLSASIGITMYPTDASSPENLIRNADQAMYAAKNGGRNQFSYFTRSMQQDAHARLRLIADLRKALSNDQLKVYYQPVVDLATGGITKAEALLRWHHPRLGLIDPPQFIPFAEESGLISEIGEWVFHEAASCSRHWGRRFGMPFQISVNKSPVQFMSRTHESNWAHHLQRLGLPGSSISVEITEGTLLNASARVADKLLQYRDAGIQVAIDDFGTGYSSMAYLRKFDIDYLKIDKSFVRDVAIDAGDRAIVRSIIAMAHELGLKVIAEGIETDEQKCSLIEAGCDYGQGFLFSRAVPPDEFEKVLSA